MRLHPASTMSQEISFKVETVREFAATLEFAYLCVSSKLCFEHGLPTELVGGIIRPLINEVRSFVLDQEEKGARKYCNGTSRSSVKRRAKYLGKCRMCGKFSHVGVCSKNQTISNMEVVDLIQNGTIRYISENPFSRVGSIHEANKEMLIERFNRIDEAVTSKRREASLSNLLWIETLFKQST